VKTRSRREIPRSSDFVLFEYDSRVDVELSPEQPPEVAEAVAAALAGQPPQPDPWWQAGLALDLDDALDP
jgi:hypothetical protein